MSKKKISYDVREYVLSCGHRSVNAVAARLGSRRENTLVCPVHLARMFIIQKTYPGDEEE